MSKKKKTIRLAKGLEIPLNITTQKTALMGGNGSGKSYLATKIEEELLRADGWVIILDPVGIHYGVRLASDGVSPSGLDIPVFGGLHGDIILTPESGALIANLLADRRLSAVLDVSQFTDSELNRFAIDFGNQFWARMKAKRQAVLLVFEECQEFVPQNPMKGEEKKLHIYTRIAKLGRNYGIGVMLISQRPQDVNKKVFNLTQLMFAFQMTGTHERKSLEEWISYVGLEERFSDILPTLEVGEPFVASPRWLKVAETFKIEEKFTYDASATPDFEEDVETIHLEPIDITTLQDRMKSLIEEAKSNDPAELKKEVARLRRELDKRPTQVQQETRVERIEIPIVKDEQIEELRRSLESVNGVCQDFKELRSEIVSLLDGKIGELNNAATVLSSAIAQAKRPAPVIQNRQAIKPAVSARPAPAPVKVKEEGDLKISGSMQRILNSLAWMESVRLYDPKRSIIAFLAGQSSAPESFKKNLSSLSKNGLIVYPDGSSVSLTEEGRARSEEFSNPITTEDLQSRIKDRLPGAQERILSILIARYPDPVDREELADLAGQSSTPESFKKNLSALSSLGVIDYPSSREAVALPALFLEER